MTVMWVLLGAPGSGKGTQALRIQKIYSDTKHISTGDILREEVALKTELGIEIEEIMNKGALVPDTLMTDLFRSVLKRSSNKMLIADGYPRTLSQAEDLKNTLAPEFGLNLIPILFDVPKSVVLQRIHNRMTCPTCKTIYDQKLNIPKNQGLCDNCGVTLIKRKDDVAEVALNRLETYQTEIKPVLSIFSDILVTISADQSPETITNEMVNAYNNVSGNYNV